MKLLGIVGGIGPESTIDYYQALIAGWRGRTGDNSYPPMVITSIDLTRLRGYFEVGDLASAAAYQVEEVERLAQAGAQFAILAANTAHLVFDEVARRSRLPMISIVEATADDVQRRGMRRVGLLGTRYTMKGPIYPDVLARHGIAVAIPAEDDIEVVHQTYFDELVPGIFKPETRARFVGIIERMRERDGIEAVILGGTELPLLFKAGGGAGGGDQRVGESGTVLLDTTRIHVARILDAMLEGGPEATR
ncbi:MAG TPA: amino acid racemase [Candidatus Polarisedimenticolia bacterium]|nr:amino acid racemase [Candidatus Polarisedimenticolia bacterium]